MIRTCITAPYTIEYQQVEKPTPAAGEVLVRMLRAGICASDMQVYHGLHKYVQYPLVQGHEGCGRVEAVGEGVTGVKPGDMVVIQPQLFCGECLACQKEQQNVCESLKHFGISHPGLFSEYAIVPEWNAVRMPEGMTADEGALVEPFSIACNAVEKGDVQPGQRVVVIGGGLIGHLIAQACTIRGAEVLVTDVLESKLEFARSHGIKHTCNTSTTDLKEKIKEVFGNKGVHVIYECVTIPATFNQAVECASKSSRLVIVGNFKQPITIEFPLLQRREIAVMSVMGTSRRNFLESVDLISKGKVDFSGIITGRFPLNKLHEAYQHIDDNKDSLRVLLEIGE